MINRIVLVGRLTADPELKKTPNGIAVTPFTLAVDRPFNNKNGERTADFIRIITWRDLAENCAKYLKKGQLAGVDGRLQVRSFENRDGQRVTISEVVADNVKFLEPMNKKGSQNEIDDDSIPF